jgi:hypothetical protein
MRVKFPAAMKAKGYSEEESKDRILFQQIRWEVAKIREGDPPPSPEAEAAAATALLTLSNHPNTPNWAPLLTITPAPLVTASNVAPAVEGGALAGILLLSPPRKTHKTSNQQQINRQNARKQKAIHDLAHARPDPQP